MRACIVTEVRIYKVGEHFYADASFAKILERYYLGFGGLSLITRIINEKKKRDGYVSIDKYCLDFENIGSVSGFLAKKISRNVIKQIKDADLTILRLPSMTSLKIYWSMRRDLKKYMVEVMGCAWDAYWNHGAVGKIVAPIMFLGTRRIVKKANYCVYVTQQFLQKRYPCDGENIGISNVDIKSVMSPKKYKDFDKKNFTMMTAAALDVEYKGQQFVIEAISKLKQEYGVDVAYYLAGKGDDARLRSVAEKYGVEKNVMFLGMLSKEALHKYMRDVDFYIQPSLQEGLPRSLIEAMSCGTVCLGANTGGIPELLDGAQIFKRRDAGDVVNVVMDTIESGDFYGMSKRNIQTAKTYLSDALDEKRSRFFDSMKEAR